MKKKISKKKKALIYRLTTWQSLKYIYIRLLMKKTLNNDSNSDTMEEKDSEDKTKKKSKPSISFDSVAIPEIHIKK
ncbi:MAG: hypothetical protein ACLT2Z_00965 [Eubacterium sp.]